MAIDRGAEELYLHEARLERQYKECEPLLQSISTIVSSKATANVEDLSETSKRAVRRLCGFWDRVVLLHQNGQLRADFFAPESPWRERGRKFRQLMEPLDTKLMQPQGQMRRSNSGGILSRPERYKFLEDQETNSPKWHSGASAPITALLAERRAALRSIDVEALQARVASLGNRPGPAAAAAGAARPARRSASLGAGNDAALARISRHDAAAAQRQSQLAAEAAAFVSARALHATTKERLTEAAGTDTPVAAAQENLVVEPAAGKAKHDEPPATLRRGMQLERIKSTLAIVKECSGELEASQPPPEATEISKSSPPPAAKPAYKNLRVVDTDTPPAVSTPASPKAIMVQKKAAEEPPRTPVAPKQAIPTEPAESVPAAVAAKQAIKKEPTKSVPATETPPENGDAGPAMPVKEQGPWEGFAPLKVPATPGKEPDMARTPSWAPTTPDQSMEAPPTNIKPECVLDSLAKTPSEASKPAPLAPASSFTRVPGLVEQLRSEDLNLKTSAAWALHDLAKGQQQKSMGDLVWEADGVIPLVAMLSPPDSTHAIAAASAIGQLASANNKAFQIGVGEAGGLKMLLGMAQSGNPKAAAAAAKALGGVVARSHVMQESLLDSGGAEALVQLLDSSPATPTEAGPGKAAKQLGGGCEDSAEHMGLISSPDLKMQLLRVSLRAQDGWERQGAAASALSSFVQGFAPAHEEVARVGGIPKLLALLDSSSETVKERAAEALLAVVGKDASAQRCLRESGGVPSVLSVIGGAAGAARGRAAEHAAALLYRLTFYQTAHAELQEAGCIEALVPLLGSADEELKRHAAWAVQNLTAGGPETEDAICEAGGVPALLSLISSCLEQPEKATLLEPATIALSNLAAGADARKEAIVEAGALPILVQLLGLQKGQAAGHAARALWNLASKHAANQDAVREAGAVGPLVNLLDLPATVKGLKAGAAQEEAAGALGALARGHAANQEAVRAAGAVTRLISLVTTGTPAVRGQAAWALQALTEGNAACQEDFHAAGGVAALSGLLCFPEQWNWTPAVGTLKNVAQGGRPMTGALLAEGAVPVMVDLLTFGRAILQVGAAETLGSMGAASKEARAAIHESGGTDKLKELCSAASVAPAAVKKAAKRSLADIGGRGNSRKRDPAAIRTATKVLNFKLRLLGLQKMPE